ncbi:MAG: hypothetical protein O7J95_03835 [Planctomycetota bacterium]|nr:hypothetical protein [Planctomycetota bacterium]
MKRTTGIFALCSLLAACTVPADFSSGVRLVYELDSSTSPGGPEQVAESTRSVVEARLKQTIEKYRVLVDDQLRLVVEVPHEPGLEDVKHLVETPGRLTFHLVAEKGESQVEKVREEEKAYLEKLREWVKKQRDGAAASELGPAPKEPEFIVRPQKAASPPEGGPATDLVLENRLSSRFDGRDIRHVHAVNNPGTGTPAIDFETSSRGAERLGELTEENLHRQLAIVLDGEVMSAPVIQSRISTSGMITGDFTQADIQVLLTVLRGGALPLLTAPKLMIEETFTDKKES